MKEDDSHFRVTVAVAESQQFFGWVFGLGAGVRIVAPEGVRQKTEEQLQKVIDRYRGAEAD